MCLLNIQGQTKNKNSFPITLDYTFGKVEIYWGGWVISKVLETNVSQMFNDFTSINGLIVSNERNTNIRSTVKNMSINPLLLNLLSSYIRVDSWLNSLILLPWEGGKECIEKYILWFLTTKLCVFI